MSVASRQTSPAPGAVHRSCPPSPSAHAAALLRGQGAMCIGRRRRGKCMGRPLRMPDARTGPALQAPHCQPASQLQDPGHGHRRRPHLVHAHTQSHAQSARSLLVVLLGACGCTSPTATATRVIPAPAQSPQPPPFPQPETTPRPPILHTRTHTHRGAGTMDRVASGRMDRVSSGRMDRVASGRIERTGSTRATAMIEPEQAPPSPSAGGTMRRKSVDNQQQPPAGADRGGAGRNCVLCVGGGRPGIMQCAQKVLMKLLCHAMKPTACLCPPRECNAMLFV